MSCLRIIHYKITKRKSLCSAERPFRFIMIADLHNNTIGSGDSVLREVIHRLSPDAVLCCGDILTAKLGVVKMDMAISLMRDLASSFPVFAVNGNHETRLKSYFEKPRLREKCEVYFRTLEKTGVVLLNNSGVTMNIAGTRVFICGFEPEMKNYDRSRNILPDVRELTSLLGKAPRDLYTILLAHNPDYFRSYAMWGADLVLSGHLHGGMVRLPGLGGVVGGKFNLFPDYDRGRFYIETAVMNGTYYASAVTGKEKGKKFLSDEPETEFSGRDIRQKMHRCEMIVSAGLGDHTIPLRVNNPPELVVLDF